jgi:hypothetical protein
MRENRENQSTDGRLRPSGDAYQWWLAAAKDSERALRAWLDGPPRDQPDLYVAYRASLDREAAAASELERLSVRDGRPATIPSLARIGRHRFAAPTVHEIRPRRVGG